MNLLWIDLWDKRSWIAYNVEWIIFSLPYVERLNLIKYLKKIVLEKKIEGIVVWLPYDLYNKDTRQLDKTLKFIEKLKLIFPDILIESIDERFTTFESYNVLSQLNLTKSEILDKKDWMSAYLILESYINKKNSQKI